MSKVKPTTKEQLVYFLLQNISLGTYDNRFLTNLQQWFVIKKPITTNQATLLDKIIERYSRQLRKKEIDAQEMVKLPWGVEPIESLPEYTDAFCTIKDGIVEIRSPYKKEFITDIKETELHLDWNKDTKIWSAPFCEATLKHFIDCLDKHYHIVHYCPETAKIINTMAEYESATNWDPTYVRTNSYNYLIASINDSLSEAIKDIPLDLDPSTLTRLTSHGIAISQDVINDAVEEMWNTEYAHKVIDFAVTDNPIVSYSDIPELGNYLSDIKCDFVLMLESFTHTVSKQVPLIQEILDFHKIPYKHLDKRMNKDEINMDQYEYPVILNLSLWGMSYSGTKLGASKTVFLGNNTPVKIK